MTDSIKSLSNDVATRTDQLFWQNEQRRFRNTDQLFQILLILQWLGAIVAASYFPDAIIPFFSFWLPSTKIATVFAGSILSLLPILIASRLPGSTASRHSIAIFQMGWSMFLVHLAGGRIETDLHVFVSLAFLACYRDWKVLATATLLVTLDHVGRAVWWPTSIFGDATDAGRWLEHVGWVVFEDLFLLFIVYRGTAMAKALWRAQAEMESTHRKEMELLERAMSETSCGIAIFDATKTVLPLSYVNQAFETMSGVSKAELLGRSYHDLPNFGDEQADLYSLIPRIEQSNEPQSLIVKNSDESAVFELTISLVHNSVSQTTHVLVIQTDVTEREKAKSAEQTHRENLSIANEELARKIEENERAEKEKERLNQELIHASRQAGMAEIATGVLHNVGNVMNSINVSAESLKEVFDSSRIPKLEMAVNLLSDPNDPVGQSLASTPKGRQIRDYLDKVTRHIQEERNLALEESTSLISNINHVCEVIATQQSFARLGGLTEQFCLNELCDDAIKLNDRALVRHGVDLRLDYAELPKIDSERHKILQVLVNFISNAKYAVSTTKQPDKRIEIRTHRDNEYFFVDVVDNGVGISDSQRKKIFQHGFTTRDNGHGFGLHSSILAAREVGGDITFDSEGSGKGTTFRLKLPVKGRAKSTTPTPVGNFSPVNSPANVT